MILLDRDGVINRDSADFVRSLDDLRIISGSLEAIAALSRAGHPVAVVTNQSGLARGFIQNDDLEAIHTFLRESVEQLGGRIDRFEVCPHHPEDECHCRKPRPGLIEAAAAHLNADPEAAILIGDRITDIEAARACGCRAILVRTGHGAETESRMINEMCAALVEVYDDLAAAADVILTGNHHASNSPH